MITIIEVSQGVPAKIYKKTPEMPLLAVLIWSTCDKSDT
jgi:hypothetical protein